VKRRDLIRELVDAGCYFNRHGKKHDIYVNHKNGKKAAWAQMIKNPLFITLQSHQPTPGFSGGLPRTSPSTSHQSTGNPFSGYVFFTSNL
jgi:hypothetical protein